MWFNHMTVAFLYESHMHTIYVSCLLFENTTSNCKTYIAVGLTLLCPPPLCDSFSELKIEQRMMRFKQTDENAMRLMRSNLMRFKFSLSYI